LDIVLRGIVQIVEHVGIRDATYKSGERHFFLLAEDLVAKFYEMISGFCCETWIFGRADMASRSSL